MIRIKCQKIILVLLMLVFSVQVLASANSYCHHESSATESAEHAMPSHMADHSEHLDLDSSAAMSTASDCCPDCDCSLSGCSTLVLLSVSHILLSSEIALPASHYNQ